MIIDSLGLMDWVFLVLGAAMLGMDKAGLRGVSIIAVPLFAGYFGGKTSASIVLPFLLTGDICALLIYRNKIRYSLLLKMLPATLVGMGAGILIGNAVEDTTFRIIMAVIVFICLILMIYKEFSGHDIELPDHWVSHSSAGFLGGLSTMIGNAAGPIMAAYLLSLNLPKEVFIGTGAIFFFVVNVLKIPIHSMVWGSMTRETLMFSSVLIPAVLLGLAVGLKIVKRIPDKPFRRFIIIATLVGTIRLFFL